MRRVIQFATGAGTAHSGTATEGSVVRKYFNVAELNAGCVIPFEFALMVSGTSPGDTLTIRVRFGTSSTVTSNTAVLIGDAIATSAGDHVIGWGSIHVQSATRYVFTMVVDNPHATGAIDDTTSTVYEFTAVADTAYYFDVTADWSTSSATNAVYAAAAVFYEDEA